MGRIRSVKPELFKHGDLFDLEKATGLPIRLAWIGLFTVADREGRFKWRHRELQTDILPYDPPGVMEKILSALQDDGFLIQYEVDGDVFGCIPKWHQHQLVRPDEAKSKIPAPPKAAALDVNPSGFDTGSSESVRVPLSETEDPPRGVGAGKEGKGSVVGVSEIEPATAQIASQGERMGIIPELRGNSRLEQVLVDVPIDVQMDWVSRWETKSVKDTLLNGINHYMNARSGEIDDWPKLLVAWITREKKSLVKRKASSSVVHMPQAVSDVPKVTAAEVLANGSASKMKLGANITALLERQAAGS